MKNSNISTTMKFNDEGVLYNIDTAKTELNKLLMINSSFGPKLNAAVCRQAWFKESNLYKFVLDATSEVKTPVSFAGRVKHVFAGIPICEICNERPLGYFNGFLKTCGDQRCSTTQIHKKRIATLVATYGKGASPAQISSALNRISDLQLKGRVTMVEKYGVTNPSQLTHVKVIKAEKSAARKIAREILRVTDPHRISNILAKYQRKLKSVELLSLEEIETSRYALDRVAYSCKQCSLQETKTIGALFYREKLTGTACAACSGIKLGSFEQMRLYDKIKKFAPDAIINDRVSLKNGQEIDIFIPSANVGVEYHGIFWHSTNQPDKAAVFYHQEKHLAAKQAGIKLLQVLSSQDQDKFLEIVKHSLGMSQKIGARRCKFSEIDKRAAQQLLENWHLDGCKMITFKKSFGLHFMGDIVAVMTISTSRFKPGETEIHRLAFKPGICVVGGVSKLVKHAMDNLNLDELNTYADATLGGEGYKAAGALEVHLTKPNYWYVDVKTGQILNRLAAQKHKLHKILGSGFDHSLTEQQNMLVNGWRVYYDAGNYKYKFLRL